jgi:CBS domain-containing protein
MQIKDIMTPDVQVVSPDATLQEAASLMRGLDIGPLPVCDGDRLVGMLTDRDIVVRSTAAGQDPKATPVRDAMTPEVIFCFEDQDVEDAAEMMRVHQIRRLLVLTHKRNVAGIVSLGDLAVEGSDDEMAGETLEKVSEPVGKV